MALITPGPLVQEISGSVGGVTFRQGAAAPTVAARRPFRRTSSPQALRWKAAMGNARLLWNATSPADRAVWNACAAAYPRTDRLGIQRTWTGRRAFTRLAAFALACGLNPPDATPWLLTPPTPLLGEPSFGAGYVTLTIKAAQPYDYAELYVEACRSFRIFDPAPGEPWPSQPCPMTPWRLLGGHQWPPGSYSTGATLTFEDETFNAIGQVAVGEAAGVRVYFHLEGSVQMAIQTWWIHP